MKNTFESMPIVSLAMIAAINIAQVNISIRAKVPNTSFGLASIPKAYLQKARKDLTPGTPGGYTEIVIPEIKKRAIHRAKILQGQLKGLEKMIESEDYCMDVITQSLAVQKSLGSLNKLLVENHLATHVKDMMVSKDPKVQRKLQEELLKIYEITQNRQVR